MSNRADESDVVIFYVFFILLVLYFIEVLDFLS